jgi:hypothetical protein
MFALTSVARLGEYIDNYIYFYTPITVCFEGYKPKQY